jgi:hypothetical protein
VSKPASRLGQAFLSPAGSLFLVVSDPWLHPWRTEDDWRHDVVVFAGVGVGVEHHRLSRGEDTVAELEDRRGWTRLT